MPRFPAKHTHSYLHVMIRHCAQYYKTFCNIIYYFGAIRLFAGKVVKSTVWMCPALLVKIRLGWKCDAKKFYEVCLWNAPAASLVGALQKFVIKRRLVKLIGQR